MRNLECLPLLAVVCLFAAGGATCLPRNLAPPAARAPVAFSGPPTLEDIIRVVNANTDRVQRLQTIGAALTVDGYPQLRADLAVERPMRLRLQAGTPWSGSELDLGSNDELVWIWVRQQRPPALYFARHEDLERGAARAMLPVPPTWLMEAIGLVRLDPQALYDAPQPRGPGRVEIVCRTTAPGGPSTRVTVVDTVYGWVLQQNLFDRRGQLLASAIMSEHEFDPVHAVSLPRRVDVSLPPAQLAFTLQIDGYVINQFFADGDQLLWERPQVAGVNYVDLGDPRVGPPMDAATVPMPREAGGRVAEQPAPSWVRRYQGFSGVR